MCLAPDRNGCASSSRKGFQFGARLQFRMLNGQHGDPNAKMSSQQDTTYWSGRYDSLICHAIVTPIHWLLTCFAILESANKHGLDERHCVILRKDHWPHMIVLTSPDCLEMAHGLMAQWHVTNKSQHSSDVTEMWHVLSWRTQCPPVTPKEMSFSRWATQEVYTRRNVLFVCNPWQDPWPLVLDATSTACKIKRQVVAVIICVSLVVVTLQSPNQKKQTLLTNTQSPHTPIKKQELSNATWNFSRAAPSMVLLDELLLHGVVIHCKATHVHTNGKLSHEEVCDLLPDIWAFGVFVVFWKTSTLYMRQRVHTARFCLHTSQVVTSLPHCSYTPMF